MGPTPDSLAVAVGVAVFVVYATNFFRTAYSVHAPWERWIQRSCANAYLEHAVGTGRCERKICAFGRDVGLALATAVLLKDDARRCGMLTPRAARRATVLMWTAALCGGLVMNLNFSAYLCAPAAVDLLAAFAVERDAQQAA